MQGEVLMSFRPLVTVAIAALLAPGLIGCGGGGSGDGPVATQFGAHERRNPGAEDLLDHWNDPERLRSALGLVAVQDTDARRAAIGSLLAGAGGSAAGTGTKLRNIRADDIEIIGENDGITYGQWRGGPAGTLNIEFDWRFAENADRATRARMERAGKTWSYRILDEFGTHEAQGGTTIYHGDIHMPVDEAVTTDGVLIFVLDKGPDSDDISSGGFQDYDYSFDDLEPWLGSILLSRQHHDNTSVLAHEIGHVLGIFPDRFFPSFERYANYVDNTFDGPEAMRGNGGAPLPFQWINADREPLAPGTRGAEVDYGHPGVCSSVMAYCSRDRNLIGPSALDFAILTDLGYEILDQASASEPELYGYGAWGRYGAWGVGVERRLSGSSDRLRAAADAFGMNPATNLADSTVLTGEVTWTGSLLGVDTGHAALPPVFGEAALGVDLAVLTGTARFDNLIVDVNGVSRAFRMPNLEYAVGIVDNGFSDEEGRIMGGFFGPAHEEMAGVLDDRDVRLLAGFGGTR